MCDFTPGTKCCISEAYNSAPQGCPACFEPTSTNRYGNEESCGLASCIGQPPVAPCGSNTCPFKDETIVCTEHICPYIPSPLIDCVRPDGKRCDPTGIATCLQDLEGKSNVGPNLGYKDFTKYTFNIDKYLPKSYLPGDGADYLYGYNTKMAPEETGAGPCGSFSCGISPLDYVLEKLSAPLDCSLDNGYFDYCGGPVCPRKPGCPYLQPKDSTCGAPSCPYGAKSDDPCGPTSFSYARNQNDPRQYSARIRPTRGSSRGASCGAPDCSSSRGGPFRNDACGAPDCPSSRGGAPFRNDGCGAPDCPSSFGTPFRTDSCGAPDCPSGLKRKSSASGACGGMRQPCGAQDCPAEGRRMSCGAPDCKFARKPSGYSDSTCGAPDCTNRVRREPCGAPDCVFAKRKGYNNNNNKV